jgi:hypothetical protein
MDNFRIQALGKGARGCAFAGAVSCQLMVMFTGTDEVIAPDVPVTVTLA